MRFRDLLKHQQATQTPSLEEARGQQMQRSRGWSHPTEKRAMWPKWGEPKGEVSELKLTRWAGGPCGALEVMMSLGFAGSLVQGRERKCKWENKQSVQEE